MRIRTHDDITGTGEIFRDQLMTYTLADLVDATPCLLGKTAQKNMVIGKLLSGTGSSVVQEYYCLLRLGQSFKTALLKLSYGERSSGILDERPIHIGNHHVPSFGLAM